MAGILCTTCTFSLLRLYFQMYVWHSVTCAVLVHYKRIKTKKHLAAHKHFILVSPDNMDDKTSTDLLLVEIPTEYRIVDLVWEYFYRYCIGPGSNLSPGSNLQTRCLSCVIGQPVFACTMYVLKSYLKLSRLHGMFVFLECSNCRNCRRYWWISTSLPAT